MVGLSPRRGARWSRRRRVELNHVCINHVCINHVCVNHVCIKCIECILVKHKRDVCVERILVEHERILVERILVEHERDIDDVCVKLIERLVIKLQWGLPGLVRVRLQLLLLPLPGRDGPPCRVQHTVRRMRDLARRLLRVERVSNFALLTTTAQPLR